MPRGGLTPACPLGGHAPGLTSLEAQPFRNDPLPRATFGRHPARVCRYCAWVSRHRVTTVAERIEDALREIGVLLIAFAPLDAVLAEPGRIARLLLFSCLGIFLFIAAVLLERRRARDV